MSRPLRIEGENLWYHVFNRGNNKDIIFCSDDDYHLFLELLFPIAENFSVEIHAFCLMPNHFHMFVFTHLPNISRFMQTFTTSFVKQYNIRHDRVGHLFQDRFKSPVVDSNQYGKEIIRYIHLNPARTKAVSQQSLRERLRLTRTYPWSSYRAYRNVKPFPWPVETDLFLPEFGATRTQRYREFDRYLLEGLVKEDDPFENCLAASILGSETFIDRIAHILQTSRNHDHSAHRARRIVFSRSLEKVVQAVCAEFNVLPEHIVPRQVPKYYRCARKVLLWTAAHVCRGKYTLTEIGQHCGGISVTAVVTARTAVEKELQQNTVLKKHIQSILHRLHLQNMSSWFDPWMEMYQRLVDYYTRFGHCHVPRGYLPDMRLSAWVAQQRLVRKGQAFNAHTLSTEQIALLDNLGFSW